MSTTKNYAGIPDEFANAETSKIVLIPVPYDGTSTWGKGADKGPEAFLHASSTFTLFAEPALRYVLPAATASNREEQTKLKMKRIFF